MTQTVSFEDLVVVKIDNRGKTPPIVSSGYPLLEINAISRDRLYPDLSKVCKYVDQSTYDTWFRQHLNKDDVLFTTVGTIAESAIVPAGSDATVAQNILGFRFNSKLINPLFALYLMRSKWFISQITGRTIETVQKSIKWSDMRKIKVELPDLETQKKIANILGAIDEKIELNRRMNETLEQMGQALFRHYFVDNPEAERWGCGTIADLGEVITGKTPSKAKAEYYGNDVMFLKVPDMHDRSIIIKTEDMLSSLGADSQKKKYIPKWSTCVSCIATVGIISLAGEQLQTNQQINSIVPKNRSYVLFNYYLMKSKSETLKTMASGGSATPNLNKGHFESIKIKLPPAKLLEKFQNESEGLLDTMDENTKQIQTLTLLRDTLLPRLISGKVKV